MYIIRVVLFLILVAVSPVLFADTNRIDKLVVGLQSDSFDVRDQSTKEIIAERDHLCNRLIQMVDLPVVLGEEWDNTGTSRNRAIKIIGIMRAVEAVPSLLKWLVPPRGCRLMDMTRPPGMSPAGKALISIGQPAVPALVDYLQDDHSAILQNPFVYTLETSICLILVDIEGPDKAVQEIEAAKHSTSDKAKQERLNAAIERIKKLSVSKESIMSNDERNLKEHSPKSVE